MIMRPSSQLKKMITDPPRNALYPAQNLDGDIFSDISAAWAAAPPPVPLLKARTAPCCTRAPHGTAHDLYLRYLANRRRGSISILGLIYAVWPTPWETLAQREDNQALADHSKTSKRR